MSTKTDFFLRNGPFKWPSSKVTFTGQLNFVWSLPGGDHATLTWPEPIGKTRAQAKKRLWLTKAIDLHTAEFMLPDHAKQTNRTHCFRCGEAYGMLGQAVIAITENGYECVDKTCLDCCKKYYELELDPRNENAIGLSIDISIDTIDHLANHYPTRVRGAYLYCQAVTGVFPANSSMKGSHKVFISNA